MLDLLMRAVGYVRRQLDPSEEPVRLSVFAVVAVAAVAHRYFADLAVELDALGLIVASAWARSKVSPSD